jgi:hypothetical protein
LHVLKLPHDYGVMCWIFVLLGAPRLFLGVYSLLFAFNALYLALALIKWFRELRGYDRARANDGGAGSAVGPGLPRSEARRG